LKDYFLNIRLLFRCERHLKTIWKCFNIKKIIVLQTNIVKQINVKTFICKINVKTFICFTIILKYLFIAIKIAQSCNKQLFTSAIKEVMGCYLTDIIPTCSRSPLWMWWNIRIKTCSHVSTGQHQMTKNILPIFEVVVWFHFCHIYQFSQFTAIISTMANIKGEYNSSAVTSPARLYSLVLQDRYPVF